MRTFSKTNINTSNSKFATLTTSIKLTQLNSTNSANMASMRTNDRITARKEAQKNNKPFCAFCFDIGKSLAIYTSHYVRETPAQDSRIVCPELKSCRCMGCGKQGHTIRNCRSNKESRMGENTKIGIDAPYKNRHDQNPKKYHKIQPKNIYSLLNTEDEETDEEDFNTNASIWQKTCFATLSPYTSDAEDCHPHHRSISSSVTTENDISMKSYAAALMSVLQPKEPQAQSASTPNTNYDLACFKTTKRYTCWADADSSDDEE